MATTYTYDTYANIIALSPKSGDIAYPSDYPEFQAECYTSGTWQWAWRGIAIETVPTTGWSWLNQGGATITRNGPVETLSAPATVGYQARCRVRTALASPWTVRMWYKSIDAQDYDCGLFLRDSATGEMYRLGTLLTLGGTQRGLNLDFAADFSTLGSALVTPVRIGESVYNPDVQGVEVYNDGVNLSFRVMLPSGPYEVFSEGVTARMTNEADQYGFYMATDTHPGDINVTGFGEL